MLEVSREAVAAGEEQPVSCGAEQSKYFSICTVAVGPCGDLPFTSWGRWKCPRGGADVGFNSFYAVCGCGTECRCGACRGETCGDMLELIRALPLRSPTRRWRALPLAEMVPFHSTQAAGSKFPSKVLSAIFEIVLED
jgi:hypothetical protein